MLQGLNVLENTCSIFQNLNLTWAYVVLNGDFQNVLFFCYYFPFLSSPSPSPIAIRCKLGGHRHSQKSKLVKNYNDSKFGLKFMKTIGCGKSRDLKSTFLKQKKIYKASFKYFTRCRFVSDILNIF